MAGSCRFLLPRVRRHAEEGSNRVSAPRLPQRRVRRVPRPGVLSLCVRRLNRNCAAARQRGAGAKARRRDGHHWLGQAQAGR